MGKREDYLSSVPGCLMGLYFLISQVMTIVFFIEYCRKDPLLEIIFMDSWLSELKGLLWIFFIW